jgi:hypothetical protein
VVKCEILRRLLTISIAVLVTLVLSGSIRPLGQSATTRCLLDLVDAADIDDLEPFSKAAIDAGAAAIPALRNVMDRTAEGDPRLLALVASAYIGGDEAISLVRRELQKNPSEDLRATLAAVLGSSGTAANRRELIRLLSQDPDDFRTTQNAAFSLGLLRVSEAVPPLQAAARRVRDRDDSIAAQLALLWIQKGYWKISGPLVDERSRVIAAVLANGSPNIDENFYVVDEEGKGYWKHGSAGWVFTLGEPTDPNAEESTIKAYIGTEGSRALVSVGHRCGLRCGSGYDFVLRREGRNWKVQLLMLTWIS